MSTVVNNVLVSLDDGIFSINGSDRVVFPGYYDIYFSYEDIMRIGDKSYKDIKEKVIYNTFLNKNNSREAFSIAKDNLPSNDCSYSRLRLIENSVVIEFNARETMNKLINHNNDHLGFNDIFENFLEIGLEYLDYCILKVKSVDEETFFDDNEIKTILLHGLSHQLSLRLKFLSNIYEIENILMGNVGVDTQTIKDSINDLIKTILNFLIKSNKLKNKATGNNENQYHINQYLESNEYMIKDMIEVLSQEVDSYRRLVLASIELNQTIEEEKRLREHHELYNDVLTYHNSLIASHNRSSQLDMITSQIQGMNEIIQLNRQNIINIGQSFSQVKILNNEGTIDEIPDNTKQLPITKKIAISLKRVWTG